MAHARSLAEIIDRLKQLVAQLDVQVAAGEIGETTFLFEGGVGLDSFAILELIAAIEQEFDIEFQEEDLTPDSFQDLQTLGGVIARNLAGRA